MLHFVVCLPHYQLDWVLINANIILYTYKVCTLFKPLDRSNSNDDDDGHCHCYYNWHSGGYNNYSRTLLNS